MTTLDSDSETHRGTKRTEGATNSFPVNHEFGPKA